MITADQLRELLHYDPETGVFTWKQPTGDRVSVGCVINTTNSRGYVVVGLLGRRYKAHRLAWLYVYGELPSGEIDHRDEDTSNNRIANLRIATHSQNGQNQLKARRDSSTGYRGVHYEKRTGRYSAQIQADGVVHRLGRFDTAEQAYNAYLAAKSRFHPFWVDNR